jgi:hypothetical protein
MRRRSLILAAASFAAVAPGAAREPATILTVLGKIRRSNTNGEIFRFTDLRSAGRQTHLRAISWR